MKVKFKANACGFGFGYPEGAEAELSKAEAEKAVEYGCAVYVSAKEADKPTDKPEKKKADK